ncbi:MAG: hypothetical protein BroJett014_07830 [Planctomycetota bacterium]|nr:MAG: hypothetical protein BroJett014_07830 [Planctomycetota bacterium]
MGTPAKVLSNGTMMTPPPTPKSVLATPASSAVATIQPSLETSVGVAGVVTALLGGMVDMVAFMACPTARCKP